VGRLPTTGKNAGTSAGERAGCLIVLNSAGDVVRTIAGGPINGPWDMTGAQVGDDAVLFVTNVLNGLPPTAPPTTVVDRGTVVRVVLDLRTDRVESETVIANSLPERNDPAALVVGPTGVALGFRRDTDPCRGAWTRPGGSLAGGWALSVRISPNGSSRRRTGPADRGSVAVRMSHGTPSCGSSRWWGTARSPV
jgi:hypothetical protein